MSQGIDLDHFRNRVHAAVSTNQCLDYAQDVTDLIGEVERLRAGIEAAWEFYEAAYTKSVSPFIGYSEMRANEATHITASKMWDAIGDALGPGWKP